VANISLTNIIKAEKGQQTSERIKSAVLSMRLLDEIAALLASEGLEERVKLCFVLGEYEVSIVYPADRSGTGVGPWRIAEMCSRQTDITSAGQDGSGSGR
jgi:hypothetical protein